MSHLLVTEDPILVSDHVAKYSELTEDSYMMMQSLISFKPIETKTTYHSVFIRHIDQNISKASPDDIHKLRL